MSFDDVDKVLKDWFPKPYADLLASCSPLAREVASYTNHGCGCCGGDDSLVGPLRVALLVDAALSKAKEKAESCGS